MPPTTQTPAATISYTATSMDTLPAIASRFYAQTGYGSFSQLLNDIMAANPQLVDWTGDLDGQPIMIPTTVGS